MYTRIVKARWNFHKRSPSLRVSYASVSFVAVSVKLLQFSLLYSVEKSENESSSLKLQLEKILIEIVIVQT